MPVELFLGKTPAGVLVPVDQAGQDIITGWKVGRLYRGTFTSVRNYVFHKRFFAMLNATFEAWEPPYVEWAGIPGEKDYDTFREQVTILAGFHDVVIDVRGHAKAKAKSISFANMDQENFEKLYGKVFVVCWNILMAQSPRWTKAEFERVVAHMENFA